MPTHLTGDDAASLIAGWTALWHPALLAATGELPTWCGTANPPDPESLQDELVVVPGVSSHVLDPSWLERCCGAVRNHPPPIVDLVDRQEIIAALEALSLVAHPKVDVKNESRKDPIQADFFALGYAYLQIELLTHAMRYSGVVDVEEFAETVTGAARAAVNGDPPAARDALAHAFDLLTQARSHYYPVDSYLVDVTLLTESVYGKPLRQDLAFGTPTSLLATGSQIAGLAEREPSTLAVLREAIQQGAACVVGGPMTDDPLTTMLPEQLFEQFRRGREVYRHHLGRQVDVFGRFTSDRSPLIPQLLEQLGFDGALLTTFDGKGGRPAQQSRTRWCGPDGRPIDALSTTPLDAGRPETFLSLAHHLSRTMQHDHVATVLLAGWPGSRNPFFDDLRRAARYGPVLGRFVTLEQFFAEKNSSDLWSTQQVSAASASGSTSETGTWPRDPISSVARQRQKQIAREHATRLEELAGLVESWAPSPQQAAQPETTQPETPVERIGRAVSATPQAETQHSGMLAVNGWSFPRTLTSGSDRNSGTSAEAGIGNREGASPETGCFFARVPGAGYSTCAPLDAPPVPLAEGNRLRNELLEVVISRSTGGIQSLRSHSDRNNRASQRLVWNSPPQFRARKPKRLQDSVPESHAQMEAEGVEITRNDREAGAAGSWGRLVDSEGKLLARFRQEVLLTRHSPVAIVSVEFEDHKPPTGRPWESYYASRIVWAPPETELWVGAGWTAQAADRPRLESPDWVEVRLPDNAGRPVTLFPLGLPYHRQVSQRALDTLLITQGETASRFRFAIGLDCSFPLQTALGLLTPVDDCVTKAAGRPTSETGWFVHASAKNVVITHLEPLLNGELRLRLLETEGRPATAHVACGRPFVGGRLNDFCDAPLEELAVEQGRLVVALTPYQWVQLEGKTE